MSEFENEYTEQLGEEARLLARSFCLNQPGGGKKPQCEIAEAVAMGTVAALSVQGRKR